MQKIIFLLKAITIILFTASCSSYKGVISSSDCRVVEYRGKQYLIKDGAVIKPAGAKCTVKPTRVKNKANVIEIKH